MTNRLRTLIEEEPAETVDGKKPETDSPENLFSRFFNKGFFSAEAATSALPFILFLALLGMVYIANMNFAEKNVREIDNLTKEVKEWSYDYKTTKAQLAFKSTLSEVEKHTDSLGLKAPLEPPKKIIAEEGQDDDTN
jgi:hypothetical protein